MKKLLLLSGLLAGIYFIFRRQTTLAIPLTKDEWLAERVKAEVRMRTSHPELIAVSAEAGRVELKGPILRDEVDRLLSGVRSVRGVDRIDDDLEAHDRAEHVPGLT